MYTVYVRICQVISNHCYGGTALIFFHLADLVGGEKRKNPIVRRCCWSYELRPSGESDVALLEKGHLLVA